MLTMLNVMKLKPTCSDCGASEFTISDEEARWKYGDGEDAYELSAVVPVYTCDSCGYQFTSGEARTIEQEEYRKYLAGQAR
mgnify:FL=1